jgi:hypothetical protein
LRSIACVLLGFLPAVLLVWGCEDLKNPEIPNAPPETYLAQVGDVDTVNSHVVLHWWGQDTDGEIRGFRRRWDFNLGSPDSQTTGWVFTTAYEDTFELPATDSLSPETTLGRHRFLVAAVDLEGLEDPTPATQVYSVSNAPPTLRFRGQASFPSVTLPAFTVTWSYDDEDGRETVSHFLAWLDAATDTARIPAPESIFTFEPAEFEGRYGTRTLHLRAVDDAGAWSRTLRYSWDVTEPVGDVLLVDDTPEVLSAASDPFYKDNLDSVLGPGSYSSIDLEQSPFRTMDEADAVLSLFSRVVWYQGAATVANWPDIGTSLSLAGNALEDLLARGGSILLESMNAFGTGAALPDSFARAVLGVDSLFVYPVEGPQQGTTNHRVGSRSWDNQFYKIAGDTLQGLSGLRPRGFFDGVECFSLEPGADTLYTVPAGIIFDGQPPGYHVGTLGTAPGGGRFAYLSFPLSRCDLVIGSLGDTEALNDDDLRLLLVRELGF